MFWYTDRPSSTAATIEANESSSRIMSEASRARSVPVSPIDTPMSARLRAGASFTPLRVRQSVRETFGSCAGVMCLDAQCL
jgi:hypothetical protein